MRERVRRRAGPVPGWHGRSVALARADATTQTHLGESLAPRRARAIKEDTVPLISPDERLGQRPPRRFVSATVSRDPGGAGAKTTLGLSGSQRYDLRRLSDLSPNALSLTISSASVSRGAAHDSESSLYLFSGQTLTGYGDFRRSIPQTLLIMRANSGFVDFHGEFLRVTLPPGAAGASSVDDLATAAFDDKTNSLLLVDRWRNGATEETVSAANTFTAGWDAAFLGLIPSCSSCSGAASPSAESKTPCSAGSPSHPPPTRR